VADYADAEPGQPRMNADEQTDSAGLEPGPCQTGAVAANDVRWNDERIDDARAADSRSCICSILHIPPPSEKWPNFTILNSLFTISVFYPPLLPGRVANKVEAKVEVKVQVEV
jgi:hypothetical protein